jgi:spermidine/putrescine-binding protein
VTPKRPLDPALLRGMTMPRISRRAALRGAGLLSASAILAACGVEGSGNDEAPQAAGFWDTQKKAGRLDFANWPLYMDQDKVGGKTVYPSLQQFSKETGIKVNYKEVIQDNDAFLGKINPSLKAGQPTGWDLIVITNGGSIEKLIRQNFLIELDHSKLPNLQKYAEAEVLQSGNAWISMAYSGDIFILNNSGSPDIKFVVPKEGAVLWQDNMAIPKGAKHPLDAITYMDYVYRPDVATMLTEYIAYITPVPSVKDRLQADAAKAKGEDKDYLESLIDSPLVFPTEADLAKAKRYRVLSVEEEQVWDRIFQPIVQS